MGSVSITLVSEITKFSTTVRRRAKFVITTASRLVEFKAAPDRSEAEILSPQGKMLKPKGQNLAFRHHLEIIETLNGARPAV